ncbi:MAG: hypothetical protein E7613_05110 [Ruminococcaceae bacterium]|nr:hypothetical protein [Oscillospiraceae bacterium]
MKFKRIFLVFIVAAVSFTTVFLSSDDYNVETKAATLSENKETVKTLESDLKSIQDSLGQIKRNIDAAKQGQADQIAIKKQLDEEITLTEREIETITKLIDEYNTQITETETAIGEKESEIQQTLDVIAERLVMQQETGTVNILSYILGSADFTDLLTRIEVADALFEYDRILIEDLSSDKFDLEVLKDEVVVTRDKCNESITSLEAKKVELGEKIEVADSYLKSYQNDESKYQEQYNAKEAEANSISNEIKEIQAKIKEQERVDYTGNGFRFPLPYDVTYWNTGGFGWRVWKNGSRPTDFHRGIDFACVRGTPILASNSGTVILSKRSSSFGLYIIIDHGGGVTSLYAHCSKLIAQVGDKVQKGDKIAEVGSTGNSTGNHLHFAMLENGEYVDPKKYITEPK